MTTNLFLLKFLEIRAILIMGECYVGAGEHDGIRRNSIHWLTKVFDRVILKAIIPEMLKHVCLILCINDDSMITPQDSDLSHLKLRLKVSYTWHIKSGNNVHCQVFGSLWQLLRKATCLNKIEVM